jgi:hypothetical protein
MLFFSMTLICDAQWRGAPPRGGGGGRDWRRSFVNRVTSANRRVEYLLNSQCRETREVDAVLLDAIQALEAGIKPDLVEDGLGGTYFIKNRAGKSIAVFKPRDEEALAPNNPKAHVGAPGGATQDRPQQGMKEGILVGEAAINEYAAFLLDQNMGLALRAGVCPTALVRIKHSAFHSAREGTAVPFRE